MEPGLFKKVTGLDVKDFELLVSLGVFNDALMNDAVYKFKRYEDASLEYAGIKHAQRRKNWLVQHIRHPRRRYDNGDVIKD